MDVEQLRKCAQDRLAAGRRDDPELKLSDVQLAIAREQGFPSWPRMRAYLDRVAVNPDGLQFAYHEDLDYYEGRAEGLLASAQDGTPPAVQRFDRYDLPLTRATGSARQRDPSWFRSCET